MIDLNKLLSNIAPSKAIFTLDGVIDNSFTFTVKPNNMHSAPYVNSNSPIEKLINNRYIEFLREGDNRKFFFESALGAQTILDYAYRSLIDMWKAHSGHKKPRQTKMYDFLRSRETLITRDHGQLILELYEYVNKDDFLPENTGIKPFQERIKDVLHILELLKNKYEK